MGTILLVEDDETLQRMYKRAFDHAGLNLVQAVNGKECLEQVAKSPPNLIILDIMMPEMDGIQVLKKLKSDESTGSIPVLILTNIDNDTATNECLNLGAVDYIVKSQVDIDSLVNKVKSYLG